jgi:hypothetical protein
MNQAEFERGFEIIFNTQHGKNAMFFIMQEFLGGWQLSHENKTCYDRHLNAIYDAIKAARVKNVGKKEDDCKVCRKLVYISYGISGIEEDPAVYEVPFCPVCGSVDVVKKPERETPEGYENRTGNPWGDASAVYMRVKNNDWQIMSFREAKFIAKCCRMDNILYTIYCANSDAGMPGEEQTGNFEERQVE